MTDHPLVLPADRELLARFLDHFHVDAQQTPRQLLTQVATAFSRLPYENLSKVIKYAECGNVLAARQFPQEILDGHFQFGTGGTCFSLTATLLCLVRSLGFTAEPILADRSYGADTHCALLVWVDEHPHLLDPGFLLVDPVPLPHAEVSIHTGFNTVILIPHSGGKRIDLFTRDASGKKYRLTFKTSPVDAGEFLRAWDASYGWEMMQYPLLTRVSDQSQLYLRGSFEQIRQSDQVVKRNLRRNELPTTIANQFGIHESVVRRALDFWRKRGSL